MGAVYICAKLDMEFKFKVPSELIRSIDNPVIVGDGQKLRDLGFKPSYDLDRSLEDIILCWRRGGV